MARKVEFTPEQEARMAGQESHTELARQFGIGETPIRRWRREHNWTALPQFAELQDLGEPPSDEELLREENTRLRAALRSARREDVGNERVIRAIEEAAARAVPLPYPSELRSANSRKPQRDSDEPHHRHAALWSDWHLGEVVDKDQMNGLNEYNLQVAAERVAVLVRSMLSFKRVSPSLTGLDIWALGDMASGKIHRLEETNEVPAAEQYVRAGYLMADAIRELAPHYPEIYVGGIVGNHPRAENDPASKDSYNSGDWIAYEMARALTRDLKNVAWEIPRGGMIVRQFGGKNFLLWHGDGIKGNVSGVPWVALTRRVNSLKETYAAMGVRIDYIVVGHFHQRSIVPALYMNGSLIGNNEHGIKNYGGGDPPKQVIVEFDEKRSRETAIKTISFEPVTR